MDTSNSYKAKTATTPFYHKNQEETPQQEESQYYKNEKQKRKKQALESLHVLSSKLGNCRYPGLSEFQSESTMQHSSYCWTIPRQIRFEQRRSNKNDSMYTLPSTKMGRTTTLGLGLRGDFGPSYRSNSPSPNQYNINTCFDANKKSNKGITISNKYREVMDDAKKFPGPGRYNIKITPKGSDIPITLKSRQMFFYDEDLRQKKHTVSMQRYSPSLKLVQSLRYNSISFGLGKRTPNENISIMKNPGPGAYIIPSIFAKGIKNKVPLN